MPARASGSRPKKRKGSFKKGHKFYEPKDKVRVEENNDKTVTPVSETVTVTAPTQGPPPTTPTSNPPPPKKPNSRSRKKLLNRYDSDCSDEADPEIFVSGDTSSSENTGFRMIDLEILQSQIAVDLVCRHCGAPSELQEERRCGLGSTLRFVCENSKCNKSKSFFSDPAVNVKNSGLVNHSVNRRLALAMRIIGCGLTATKTFCGMMNLPPPVLKTSFSKVKESIHQAVTTVQAESMKRAAEIEYTLNEKKGLSCFHFTQVILS